METLFLVCAVFGGVLMVLQFAMSLAGFGAEHDLSTDHHFEVSGHDAHGHDHGSSWFFKMLGFRALVAAVTFFGLAGMAASKSPAIASLALPIGLVAGFTAMVVVAWLMGLLSKLQTEGTVQIEGAIGASGSVYLTIPPHGQGLGKVTIKVQNRTMEYQAVTQEERPLETGTPVVVVGVAAPGTVEVGPMPE